MKTKLESGIHVYSEIGQLRKVLVKRPGRELSFISPSNCTELLFSAILDWRQAANEHDEFCKILTQNGVEVVYIEDLLLETWNSVGENEHNLFIKKFIEESKIKDKKLEQKVFNYLKSRSTYGVFESMISGITTFDLQLSLERDVLVTQPMPNLYFTRDTFSSVGNGVVISSMKYPIRKRETLFTWFIFTYHPLYKHTPQYLDRNNEFYIEGGDVFPYNTDTLVVGVSDRTKIESVKNLAKHLKKSKDNKFKRIVAINVPHKWNLMHLDTWLIMVDYDKFLYSPNVTANLKFWKIDLTAPKLSMVEYDSNLESLLESIIGKLPIMIPVAGAHSQLAIDVETHFDATNFLVIKPGLVVGYSRNYYTIEALRKAGVEVLTFNGDQLSLGMGSSRCMSMPLVRDDIKIKK